MSNWIIINGARKLKQQALDKIQALKSSEITTIVQTEHEGHATQLAQDATLNSASKITAVGGDGTIHEVINGMNFSLKQTLGIIPNGSGNDYIRSLQPGINEVRFLTTYNGFKEERCANILDVGFGGHVIQLLAKFRKRGFKGNVAYSAAIVRAFFTFKKVVIEVTIDNQIVYQGKTLMTAICKGNVFGYGITINPEADPRDEFVYITIIGNVTLLDYVKYLKRLKAGKKIRHPEVHYLKGKKVHLKTGHITAGEMDGEPFECINLDVELTQPIKVELY